MKHKYTKLFLLLIFLCGAFLRIYNLNWDEGHYLHPDERLYVNASNIFFPSNIQDILSPTSALNPNMFYYGSFPLYTYKIVSLLLPTISFLLVSRFVSAFISTLTILVIFAIGKKMFSQRVGFFAAFVFAFAPGSIQHAHFNTTESMLIFLLSCIILSSTYFIQKPHFLTALLLGVIIGLSYATKIIGLTFGLIPFIAMLPLLKEKRVTHFLITGIIILFSSIVVGVLTAPYQIIDSTQFLEEQTYMQGVTVGQHKPPFVIIYENTLPYIYQFTQILPFNMGFLPFIFGLIGFAILIKKSIPLRREHFTWLLILVFPLIYFLWAGSWYVKFARYYLLLLPFFSLYAGYILGRLHKKYFFLFIVFLIIIGTNGILMLNLYTRPHTRIEASQWIYSNISTGSAIYGEHWDDNLPLPFPNNNPQMFQLGQLAVYEPDTSEKQIKLIQDISQADYIVLSSRRVYYSILRNASQYPFTTLFYKKLFDNSLGYTLEKSFTNYPFIISDDIADESFQSYDHPPVLIFKNTKKYPVDILRTLF